MGKKRLHCLSQNSSIGLSKKCRISAKQHLNMTRHGNVAKQIPSGPLESDASFQSARLKLKFLIYIYIYVCVCLCMAIVL